MDKLTISCLRAGDRVALAAPARAVNPDDMAPAIKMLREWQLDVVVPEGLYDIDGQLAGSDTHRAALLQALLADKDIRAIFCCRGGYGTVRIIDRLDFSPLLQHPKWIVGYSDATVLHSHIHSTLELPTLHAVMPVNFPIDGHSSAATESLRRVLFDGAAQYEWETHPLNRDGVAEAPVVGGNLSILYSLLGSRSQIDTHGKILLIEDLDEYLYHIDRMMQALRRAGMLDGLAGLLVGGLTDMHDNTIAFGRTAEQIVAETVADKDYPIVFGAPFGHLGDNNLTLPLGTKMHLETSISKKSCIFAL